MWILSPRNPVTYWPRTVMLDDWYLPVFFYCYSCCSYYSIASCIIVIVGIGNGYLNLWYPPAIPTLAVIYWYSHWLLLFRHLNLIDENLWRDDFDYCWLIVIGRDVPPRWFGYRSHPAPIDPVPTYLPHWTVTVFIDRPIVDYPPVIDCWFIDCGLFPVPVIVTPFPGLLLFAPFWTDVVYSRWHSPPTYYAAGG